LYTVKKSERLNKVAQIITFLSQFLNLQKFFRRALRKDSFTRPSEIAVTESNNTTSEIQTTLLQDYTNAVLTTAYADATYSAVTEQSKVITTSTVQTDGASTDAVLTDSKSATTKTNTVTQTLQVTSPVVTTAPVYTAPVIVTSTVKPPPDRTTTSISENETTTTVDPNSYAFRISFVDDVNLENIGDVDAKLIQQQIKWIDEEHSRDVSESSVVAEWNSSDSNPYTASFLKQTGVEYRYIVIVDELPDGYSFYGKSSVEFNIAGLMEDVKNIEILLTKEEIVTPTIPLNGTYSLKLKVLDIATNKTVPALDCELYCIQTKDVVARWNTTSTEELYIKNLRYEFDKPDSYNGNITYAIRIANLPENYRFYYGKSREMYGICGFGLEEFAKAL